MPDGDIVHGKLRQEFETAYRQICEWHFGVDEIAYNLIHTVLNIGHRYGDAPVELLLRFGQRLQSLLPGASLWTQINYRMERRIVDDLALQLGAGKSKRGMEFARLACKRHINHLESGEAITEHPQELMHEYLRQIYIADFESCLPSDGHYMDVDASTFLMRLSDVQLCVEDLLRDRAASICRLGHLPRRDTPAHDRIKVDGDTDLLRL